MNLKLLGKNAIIYGAGNISLRASAFLLIPLYTHALSVRDYGILATLLLTIQLMIILMSVGMRTTLIRFAKEYEDKLLLGELLGGSLLINLLAGLAIIALTLLFLKPFFCNILHVDHVSVYLILTVATALIQTLCLHLMSYYQARNEALKYTLVGITAALLLFATNLVMLLLLKMGLKGALIAGIVSYGAILLFVLVDVLVKKTGIGISIHMIPRLLRFGFPLVFSMLGEIIMGSSGIYFLGHYQGPEVVALYSLGYKLATIVGIVLTLPFQLAFQPFVFSNINNPDIKEKMASIFTYFFLAVAFMSFFILVGSRMLLPFIAPPEYSSAFIVILLLLPAFAFHGLIIFGETLLGITKKTHIMGTIVGICSIISLFLNYFLIPVIGWYGAIIAANVSCISAGLIIIIIGMRSFPLPIEWFRTLFAAGIFTYFLFSVFLLRTESDAYFYAGSLIAFCLIIPFSKLVNFLNPHEKIAIQRLLKSVKLMFGKVASV
jgi:O-antigen/teichoic acid export membrane protein